MSLHPVLAIIPARAGSKELPRKNVRSFAGMPLIAHSIKFAAMCPEIARSVVSTESEEIAEVARLHGADVPFLRPAELAADDTPMTPVLQHALRQMEQLDCRTYGSVLLLQPTSPVRLPTDLTQALTLLEQDRVACGVVAVAEPPFHPTDVCVLADSQYLKMAYSEFESNRRQELAPVLRVTGSLFLWRRDYIANSGELRLVKDAHRLLLVPKERAFDIDDLHDFQMAELAVTSGLVPLPWLSSAASHSALKGARA